MIKKLLQPLALGVILLLAACAESSYETHQTYFFPQYPGGMNFYADQESDTIHLISLDSWTARSATSWLKVSPESEKIPAGYIGDTRLTITSEKNTTGKNRIGWIEVKSYSNLGMIINQSHWLNITMPRPTYNMAPDFSTKEATFKMHLFPHTSDTTIVFKVYQNDATLSSNAEWLVPQTDKFEKGEHKVSLSITPNSGNTERNATLTLTSGGISTPINIVQLTESNEQ